MTNGPGSGSSEDSEETTTSNDPNHFWGKWGAIAGIGSALIALIALPAQCSGASSADIATTTPTTTLTSPLALPTISPPVPTTLANFEAPPVTPEVKSDGTVRHKGQIVLVEFGINPDLDSRQTDTQWIGDERNDLTLQTGPGNEGLSYGMQNKVVRIGKIKADYESCRNASGYSSETIMDLDPGDNVCVMTTEERFAAVQIIKVASKSMTIYATTYDPPFK